MKLPGETPKHIDGVQSGSVTLESKQNPERQLSLTLQARLTAQHMKLASSDRKSSTHKAASQIDFR